MKISKFGRQFHPAIVQHNVGKFELNYDLYMRIKYNRDFVLVRRKFPRFSRFNWI